MGRDLRYTPIKNQQHLQAYRLWVDKDCYWKGFDHLNEEETRLVQKYACCCQDIDEGRNAVDGMEHRFFTRGALDTFIREKLDKKDYRQVEMLCRIAADTDYGVVINSN